MTKTLVEFQIQGVRHSKTRSLNTDSFNQLLSISARK